MSSWVLSVMLELRILLGCLNNSAWWDRLHTTIYPFVEIMTKRLSYIVIKFKDYFDRYFDQPTYYVLNVYYLSI